MATISVGLALVGGWQVLELQSYNLMHQVRRSLEGSPSWDNRIVVIAIDDDSLLELGGLLPWQRETHAQLLNQLWSTQPAAVAFDLLFSDTTEQDDALADAIINSANVVLAVAADGQRAHAAVTPAIADSAAGFFLPGDIGSPTDIDGINRKIQLYGSTAPSFSIATLQVYAETMASTTMAEVTLGQTTSIQSEPEEVFSHPISQSLAHLLNPPNQSQSQPSEQASSKAHHHRASGHQNRQSRNHFPSVYNLVDRNDQTQADANQLDQPPFSRISFSHSFEFGTALVNRLSDRIPDDETLWISWPGEVGMALGGQQPAPGQLQVYSYVDVLKGRVDNSRFRNKIVLIGATASGLDPLRTPFQSNPPTNGVYLHAATIDNLLNQSFLKRLPQWQSTLLLAALAIASTHLLQRQNVHRRLAVLVGFPLAWAGFAYGSFLLGWWLPVAAPVGTIALGGLAVQLRDQQEKQQLMDIFSMSVSPGTAELIWQHKDAILHKGELAAQTLTGTVLFMDIRGFTGIAEMLPSHQLLPWLNQYFETMTDCIMEHGGMVDKYIGDAIMAVFGAPLPRNRADEIQADAIAALKAALEMHQRLNILNDQLLAQNLPTIDFGIGIHTGPLIGGTVGSKNRLSYSVFGDTVNIAARLESMTKGLPQSTPFKLLLSAETSRYTQDYCPMQLFQSGNLRGRQSSTDIYTLAENNIAPTPPLPPTPIRSTLKPSAIAHSPTVVDTHIATA